MYSILAGLTSLMLGPAIPGAPPEATEEPLFSLEKELPPFLIQNNTSAMLAKYDGIPLMDVTFDKVDWPNVFFKAPEKVWDWSEMLGIAVDIYNPESVPINVAMRIDNEGGNGLDNCITLNTVALPGKWVTFFAPMGSGGIDRFWGMRSVADCPAFVGCHWFQYVDEPTTGRWFDGENYNPDRRVTCGCMTQVPWLSGAN